MLKPWIKYLLYTLLTLILLAGGLAAYLLANKQQIKQYAIEQINAHLQAKVAVNNINLTLFKQFPKVSLDLHLVNITDSLHKNQPLLEAQHIYIGFNIYDIIRKQYNIKLIAIDSATINLYTDAKGRSNYMIWKTTNDTTTNENVLVNLKEVVLNNVRLNYHDVLQKQTYDLSLQNVTLSGDFSSKGEHIACKGLIYARKVKTNQLQLLHHKLLTLDLELDINNQSSTYTFKKGLVDIDLLQLDLKGSVANKKEGILYNLKIGARNLNIPGLLSLLPATIKLPEDIKTGGDLHFTGIIQGIQNKQQSPTVTLEFGVKNGTLSKGDGPSITNLQLTGQFSNGTKPSAITSKLRINNLSFTLNQGQVSGHLELSNLNDPLLQTNLQGDLNVAELLPFLTNIPVQHAEGKVQFDVNFNGKLGDVNAQHWLNNKASGTVILNLKNIQLKQQPNQPINQLDAELVLEHKNAIIRKLTAHKGRSDIQVSGVLNNIIPYILLNNELLEADISYQSNFIDLNNLLISGNGNDTTQTSFSLPPNLSIHAQLKAGELVYNLFSGKQVTANVFWKGKRITIENLTAQTMGGKLAINGQLENAPDGRFLISANGTLDQIDITNLFKACNDFGQQEITQKHLKGKLSGTFNLISVWSNNFTCDLNKLYALSEVRIKDGELNDYEPLNVMGKYIDVNELKNLRFADLNNTIEIKNKTIYIPQFDVKNNALNITLSGSHTFDNFIDYRVKVKLNEWLKNKRKNKPNEFNEEETSDRGVNIFMSMKGPIDNFKISYDKIGVKQKVTQELKKEQQNIKEVLKKELGLDKPQDPDIKEKKTDSDELEFEPDN